MLAAITFAVFGQTLGHEFVDFDDDSVYENPVVARGLTLKGIVWAFTHVHSANWHPLTWLSHMLDCQLYGLHPGGHHLTNVLLHTATVIALFLVLRQMTGALWRSAFVAAVFAIHPLRVESVAWVAERKDVLSGLFFMLTIGAYVRYARRPWSLARYGLVMLLFAMGLMCKPMLVTLPLVLLLLDYWPLQRVESRKLSGLVREKLPLLALSAAACVVTLLAQNEAIQSTETFSLPLRFGNALVACMVYLGQMVWPAGLAVFYPYPHNGLPAWEVALAGMLLAGLSVVAWLAAAEAAVDVDGMALVFGDAAAGGGHHPGGRAKPMRIATPTCRRSGFMWRVTWLAAEWGVKWRMGRAALGGLMAGVLAVLMVCAWKQTAYWQNSETLWTHTLACTTDNYVAHYNLGNALLQKGQSGRSHHSIPRGAANQARLRRMPTTTSAPLFCQKGRVDEAITQYQKALQIKPDNAEAIQPRQRSSPKGQVDEAITNSKWRCKSNQPIRKSKIIWPGSWPLLRRPRCATATRRWNWPGRPMNWPAEKTRSFSTPSPPPSPKPGGFPKRWKPRSAPCTWPGAIQHRLGRADFNGD